MNEKELLQRALQEIKSLRRQKEITDARLGMFDDVMSALHGQPARSGTGLIHPDLVYEIEKHLSNEAN